MWVASAAKVGFQMEHIKWETDFILGRHMAGPMLSCDPPLGILMNRIVLFRKSGMRLFLSLLLGELSL
jgi:hypothetical protein